MGMKRRGTGRRQVLNLNDKQDSPRRTWQTKYQQICAEHSSQNGDSESGTGVLGAISSTSSSKADTNNPLSGLVGPYHSDSEAEDEGREAAGNLDAKVSDFLREIQTIAPAKPQVEIPTSQMTGIVHSTDARSHVQASSAMAWQECYDENSGYIYYWNVETNAVTWEMPPEYQAYIASATSMQAQHWMMEQSMGMVPVMPAQHQMGHAAMIPMVAMASVASPRTCSASKNKTDLRPPGTAVENSAVPAAKSSGTKRTRKNAASDSEDERIEMITSYGPASEEESEDEVVLPSKKKKGILSKSKTQTASKAAGHLVGPYGCASMGPELPAESQLLLGPQLQHTECDVNSQTEEQADSEIVTLSGSQHVFNNAEESVLNPDSVTCGMSTLLSNSVPDMGPPGEELEVRDGLEEPWVQKADSLKNDQEERVYSAPDSSEDKTVTDEAEGLTKPDNSVAECESSVANSADWKVCHSKMEPTDSVNESGTRGSGNTSPVPQTTEEESDGSGETDEGVILSRLRSQARVLKELGGEIPDEIRHLIDQSASEAASPIVADDVIAQIERELPPDYSNGDNKGEEKYVTSKRKTQGSSSTAEHSPKPTSFALIAGYGDGSDQEEESLSNLQSKKNKTSKPKKSQSTHTGSSTANLFPIVNYEAQAGISKQKNVRSVTSVSGAEATADVEVEEPSGPNESIPSSSKNSEFGGPLFPAVNGDIVATESTKPQVSSEYVSSGVIGASLESNLPDSTTNSKACKRKIRLEIGAIFPSTSVPKPPTSTELSTPAITTCSDVETCLPSTTTTTTAASSTVNYSKWTFYNSDPTSGERRGFGFQSVASEDTAESFPADHSSHASAGKSLSQQKKGIINFIKAETINLPKTEEQTSRSTPDAEDSLVHGEVKAYNKEELEAYQYVEQLAYLITEKVKFLEEGKEPVSPVQIMAIQIETLVSAWHAGALSQPYLSNWLSDTGAELARLEQAAAPDGWACEWDRYGIQFNSTYSITAAVPVCLPMQYNPCSFMDTSLLLMPNG